MAQKLKRTSLLFGQAGQEPAKPTLSGFYSDVGKGQVGAVGKISEGVKAETSKVPGSFGMKYDANGKPVYADVPEGGTNSFKPTVNITTSTGGTYVDPNTFGTSSDAAGGVTAASDAQTKLKDEQTETESKLNEASAAALKAAGEQSSSLQKKLTEGKLGERREASELEKQALDYRNILATTPGTSNIKAVSNLMKFYDMRKYGALESSLRQGEMALSREDAKATQAGMETAEGARVGAIDEFKSTSEQAYKDAQKLIDAEKKQKLDEIKKFYGDKITSAKTAEEAATVRKDKLAVEEQVKAENDLKTTFTDITNNPATNIKNIIEQISGRGAKNWLNTQGNARLKPIKAEMDTLLDRANQLSASTTIPMKEKQAQLSKIKEQMNGLKGRIAGELAAFLGDDGSSGRGGTSSGDALDAAEQIVAAGLVDSLSDDQKRVVRERLERDMHIVTNDKNLMSSPEKLAKLLKAFGSKKVVSYTG